MPTCLFESSAAITHSKVEGTYPMYTHRKEARSREREYQKKKKIICEIR